ncbi:MAG: preprotein translocase subunit SecE [Acidimicrobiaceae bacterium]|nr:preprotein translocase subunit SecE [Acidimicrobiaceae bacterium]MBO0747473.1 preprotein translocase subunit SecE [Acidimicrobiaceae bacterium]
MKMNRRQRRSPGTDTDELLDQTDDEVEVARADSDGDLDADGLGSDGVDPLDGLGDTDRLDSDLDGDGAPAGRRGRRSGGTLVESPVARPRPSVGGAPGAARTTPRQFLHEVNVEMRKVAWPTRKETANYASVVFVTLAVLMAMIFGLDYGFDHLSLFLFK